MIQKFITTIALLVFTSSVYSQCTELFISEYIEGSSNNKAIELYNPTPNAINLTGYELVMKGFNSSGNPSSGYYKLTGSINSKSTFSIVNDAANATMLGLADLQLGFNANGTNLMNFTGDDAIMLIKNKTDTIDVIGNRFATASAQADAAMMQDQTLVRKPNIDKGSNADWSVAKLGWSTKGKDFIDLGNHASSVCGSTLDTTVKFSFTSRVVSENSGTISILIKMSSTYPSPVTLDVKLKSGDAADINGFTSITKTIASGFDTTRLSITITDDAIAEYKENLVFAISNPSGTVKLGKDSLYTLTINMSDIAPAEYTISQMRGNNTNGIPDSFQKAPVILRGLVYGTNQDPAGTGLRFTLIDRSTGTSGLQVNSPGKTFGYTIKEGDSVMVQGEINHFNGLASLERLDTLVKLGTGNIKTPRVVNSFDETTECDLVRMNNLTLVVMTPAQTMPAADASQNMIVQDASNKQFEIRIVNTGNVFGTTNLFSGTFDVIGIGGQYDPTSGAAKTGGYQLLPRTKSDIITFSSISKNNNLNQVVLYPNPSNGSFNIDLNAAQSGQSTITLYNNAMQALFTQQNEVNSGMNTLHFNESQLSAGSYFVEIKTESGISVKKLIIQ